MAFAFSKLLSAKRLISCATTANPFPCSPALAASMEAFKESKLVLSAISLIIDVVSKT